VFQSSSRELHHGNLKLAIWLHLFAFPCTSLFH
jgi:hypothetical protein